MYSVFLIMSKLKTIFISNSSEDAVVCEDCLVTYFMVDLEILGKEERQAGRNTLISRHTLQDVINVRSYLQNTKLLVRINPINPDSEKEITQVLAAGADAIMLPMARTVDEVARFSSLVGDRAEKVLLVETGAAFFELENILNHASIDRVHLGLNDLHLELKLNFMFQILASDAVFYFSNILKSFGIPFGIGGIAPIGAGKLSSEYIIPQHLILGSDCAILSRDFKRVIDSCDTKESKLSKFSFELDKLNHVFETEISDGKYLRAIFKDLVNQSFLKL